MSFTRSPYDTNSYKVALQQSVGPINYVMGEPLVSCEPCLPKRGTVSHNRVPENTNNESELLGLSRKLSNDPSRQYQPSNSVEGFTNYPDCAFSSEDTRLSNPSCTLRGTGWNRWQWLHSNPQDKTEIPFTVNTCNRIVVKDNHRPCIPVPIDQAPALPQPQPEQCENIVPVCANPTHGRERV